MDEYGVTKDDVVEILNGVVLGGGKSQFDQIPAKVKSAFTREYNKGNHTASNVFADSSTMFRKVVKGKRGKSKEEEKKGTPTQTESSNMMDVDENEDALFAYSYVCSMCISLIDLSNTLSNYKNYDKNLSMRV